MLRAHLDVLGLVLPTDHLQHVARFQIDFSELLTLTPGDGVRDLRFPQVLVALLVRGLRAL
jgi:hypothetical protein